MLVAFLLGSLSGKIAATAEKADTPFRGMAGSKRELIRVELSQVYFRDIPRKNVLP